MLTYVGYGFDTNEINDEIWYALANKYDNEELTEHFHNNFAEEIANNKPLNKDNKIQDAIEFINKNNTDCCEYLRNIINSEESKKAGTNYIVTSYDNFLVFDSIRFADDSKRTKYIRNTDDFITMIKRYIPIENIHFGNLYEGTDWADPAYTLE